MDSTEIPNVPPEGPAEETAASGRGGGVKTDEGKAVSRGNALRDGLRARVVFPAHMAEAITERTGEIAAQRSPQTGYEWFLVGEMGRSSVQYETASNLLIEDAARVASRADGPEWDIDRRAGAARLGGRIRRDPERISLQLAATKHGTEWLLSTWQRLGDCLRSNGRWTDDQRELAFDLRGVPLVLREGSVKVPAADDQAALARLVEREIALLQASQSRRAIDDQARRKRAARGAAGEPDSETRRLKSNASRAFGRLKWAEATFDKLRRGASPSSLIDPETNRPIQPAPPPTAAPHAAPKNGATAPPEPTSAADQPVPKPPSFPPGCPPDGRAMLGLVWATLQEFKEAGKLPIVPPTGAGPPAK
jgi:hypothetical protein